MVWRYRAIVDAPGRKQSEEFIRGYLLQRGETDAGIECGECSAGGKYTVLRFSLVLASGEDAEKTDTALREIPGLRFLL